MDCLQPLGYGTYAIHFLFGSDDLVTFSIYFTG
jgi:hypothetical protein